MSISIEKIEDIKGTKTVMLLYNKYQIQTSITITPVNNCQTFSIGMFENYLAYASNLEDIDRLIKTLRETLSFNRRQCIVDVRSMHAETIRQIFPPERIIVDAPYSSTNGSSMNLFLIKFP